MPCNQHHLPYFLEQYPPLYHFLPWIVPPFSHKIQKQSKNSDIFRPKKNYFPRKLNTEIWRTSEMCVHFVYHIHMCRVLPIPPWPAWEAILACPAWRPIWPSRIFRVCSSLKFLWFSVAILGPSAGPLYSGCNWVTRARAKIHSVTWRMLRLSNRSAVWNISSSGTPYFRTAVWNLRGW